MIEQWYHQENLALQTCPNWNSHSWAISLWMMEQYVTLIPPPLLCRLLDKYSHLFQTPALFSPSQPTDHNIHLEPNSKPVNVRPYRYPYYQKQELIWIVGEPVEVLVELANPCGFDLRVDSIYLSVHSGNFDEWLEVSGLTSQTRSVEASRLAQGATLKDSCHK